MKQKYKRQFVDDDDYKLSETKDKPSMILIPITIGLIFSFLLWIFIYFLIKLTWFT